MSYFIADFPGHPDVEKLTPDDFDLGRIQLKEPGPIPESEARWAWEWMASWGVLEGAFDPRTPHQSRLTTRNPRNAELDPTVCGC